MASTPEKLYWAWIFYYRIARINEKEAWMYLTDYQRAFDYVEHEDLKTPLTEVGVNIKDGRLQSVFSRQKTEESKFLDWKRIFVSERGSTKFMTIPRSQIQWKFP